MTFLTIMKSNNWFKSILFISNEAISMQPIFDPVLCSIALTKFEASYKEEIVPASNQVTLSSSFLKDNLFFDK